MLIRTLFKLMFQAISWHRWKKRYPGVEIVYPCYIEFRDNITFKGLAYVGPHAFWSARGSIEIGNNVIIGPKSQIWTYNHDYKSSQSIPYGGPDILRQVTIKDNVWIGLSVLIMPGVTVEEGAIVAAGSVVINDVPRCAIVGGNPAKIIKSRDIEQYETLKKQGKFYLTLKWRAEGQGGDVR